MPANAHYDFCLLIPCYNNLPGLLHSLESVVYIADKFCIVIVDDGSKEPVTESQLKEALNTQTNLTILRNEHNLGITDTLNKGLTWIDEHINTAYIARLDCGDTCHPERFFRQMEWMRNNPATGLLGTWCYFEEKATGEKYIYRTPLDHAAILKEMHLRNVFIHPTVMFNNSVLKETGLYPTTFEHAEDYAFFWRIIQSYPSAILGECLVTCEINKEGISYQNKSKQLKARWRVVKTFGSNLALKFLACARLILLFLIPGMLTLQFKKWRT
jgi:glycosyltransferase involved in cell wall biosynthesis